MMNTIKMSNTTKIVVIIRRESKPDITEMFHVRDSEDSITKKVNQLIYAFEDSVHPIQYAKWKYVDGRDDELHIINR